MAFRHAHIGSLRGLGFRGLGFRATQSSEIYCFLSGYAVRARSSEIHSHFVGAFLPCGSAGKCGAMKLRAPHKEDLNAWGVYEL